MTHETQRTGWLPWKQVAVAWVLGQWTRLHLVCVCVGGGVDTSPNYIKPNAIESGSDHWNFTVQKARSPGASSPNAYVHDTQKAARLLVCRSHCATALATGN